MGIFSPDTITDFVRRGDLEGVIRRLELGDNVNERRSFNNTPLIEAARYNVVDILELLVANGADMELSNSNDLTALHAAIDERRSATAIALARHGASANNVGLFGRTPLQCAILRDLLEVAAELLAHGADPMVESDSAKIAVEYIRPGPNSEEFEKLLNSFRNLKTALEAMNVDAITVCLRETLTGDRCAKVSGIEAAIQLKHTEAVTIIFQMSLASDTLVAMVEKHKAVERGIKRTDDVKWRQELRNLGEDYGRGVLTLLMDEGDVTLLKEFVEITIEPNWIQNLKLSNGWSPLHLAASLNHFVLVQYLLVECGCNPLLLNPESKTAYDLVVEIDSGSEVSWMLRQPMKQRAFLDHTARLLSATQVTVERLRQLPSKMTSVYDLRFIFNLGFGALSSVEMHTVLTKAFDQVIRENLVDDAPAAAFFKLGLQECRRQNLISDLEQSKWGRKATKVKVNCTREIKCSLQEVECSLATAALLQKRFNKLREALIQHELCDIEQSTRQRYLALLALTLIMCGGSTIKELFEAVFDVSDPAKLLTILSADCLDDILADKTNTIVFKSGVEAVLTHSAIDPMEFASVLRESVKLKQVEIVGANFAASEMETVTPLLPATLNITPLKTPLVVGSEDGNQTMDASPACSA